MTEALHTWGDTVYCDKGMLTFPWDNGARRGVLVIEVTDPEAARTLADEAIKKWYGDSYTATPAGTGPYRYGHTEWSPTTPEDGYDCHLFTAETVGASQLDLFGSAA